MYKQTDQTYFLEKNLQNKIYRQETILAEYTASRACQKWYDVYKPKF